MPKKKPAKNARLNSHSDTPSKGDRVAMHISGLAARFRPEQLDSIHSVLSNFSWVDVHAVERETGKMILVMEGENVHDETDKLKRLQAIPGMASVDLVYHAFESSDEITPPNDNMEKIMSHLNQ